MVRVPPLCVGIVCWTLVWAPNSLAQSVPAAAVTDSQGKPDQAGAPSDAPASHSIAQLAYLKASNTETGDQNGWSIALSGDTVVVGAFLEDSNTDAVDGDGDNNDAGNAGAAYVFVRNGTSWSQQAYLKASNSDPGDLFGVSVAIDGNTIVVGASREDSVATGVNGDQADNSMFNSGAAYVFVRNGSTWTQQAYLKASNSGWQDGFGVSVAVWGSTIAVGSFGEASAATEVDGDQADNNMPGAGAVYVFERTGSTWNQQAYVKATNTNWGDNFGSSVSLWDHTLAVGARNEDSASTGVNGDQESNQALLSGAAYIYVRDGTAWTRQAYIKASNTGAGDEFGQSIALSHDTLVVGAANEASNATGVGGDEADDSAADSGAAYVFVREGVSWSQQAYLKASNTDAGDAFAVSVSVSDDVIAIGAYREASSASGIGGDESDNGAPDAGAVYLFDRDGSSWSQLAYVKASNSEGNDWFGRAVAVDENTIAVGAVGEDSSATGVNGDQDDESATSAGAAYVLDLMAWTDMGCALGGAAGAPQLIGTGPLTDGSSNGIGLSYAAPIAPIGLVVAASSTPVPFKGGTLKPFPLLIEPILLVTNATGSWSLPFTMPPGLPSGTTLWLQAVIQDASAIQGFALSNAVVGTTP